jgi:hypothetical protein
MPDGGFTGDLAPWCVFTTAETAARGLDAIGWTVKEDLSRCRLLEPAAGEGAFVTVAARRLVRSMRARGTALHFNDFRDRVVAREIHPGLATVLRARVSRALREEGIGPAAALRLAAAWCRSGDFLADDGLIGFTHVAGNPPFMRGGGSAADICVAFVERSFRALAPGGSLAMIAPLSMASATGAARLRRMIEEQGTFEGVEVLRPEEAFVTRVSVVSGLFVVRKAAGRRSSQPRGCSGWLAGPTDACDAFERLARTMPTLEEAGCRVKLGMTTGANSIFVGTAGELPVEPELVVPAAEIRDLPNGVLAWRGRMVIVTHGPDGLPWPRRERPALYRYLSLHRQRLQRRATARAGRSWRLTHSRVDHSLAAAPKLLVPEIGRRPRVVMDPGGLMPLNSLHAITSMQWPLGLLHALLAAAAVGLASTALNLRRGGEHTRLNATHLRRVRIPRWEDVGARERVLLYCGDPSMAAEAAARLYNLDDALLRRCAAAGWEA